MAEPNLNLTIEQIKSKLGSFAGWGRGNVLYSDKAWSAKQQAEIDDAAQSGLRRFYFPAPVDDSGSSYNWSFLTPVSTVLLATGASTVLLPDDFGGIEGKLTIQTTSTTKQPWRIDWRNEGQIREMYAVTPTRSGCPMYAVVRPLKGTEVNRSQKWELFIFPLADKDYTIQLTYYVNPNYLDGTTPYAYGGAQHSETILESCLAVMEERLDDASNVHASAFASRLLASISMDRRNKPAKMGYNGDRSDNANSVNQWRYGSGVATINGISFDA